MALNIVLLGRYVLTRYIRSPRPDVRAEKTCAEECHLVRRTPKLSEHLAPRLGDDLQCQQNGVCAAFIREMDHVQSS